MEYLLSGDLLVPATVKVEANSLDEAIEKSKQLKFTVYDKDKPDGFNYSNYATDISGKELFDLEVTTSKKIISITCTTDQCPEGEGDTCCCTCHRNDTCGEGCVADIKKFKEDGLASCYCMSDVVYGTIKGDT
jgi:hypothetical protein